jgi:hypothetical protein
MYLMWILFCLIVKKQNLHPSFSPTFWSVLLLLDLTILSRYSLFALGKWSKSLTSLEVVNQNTAVASKENHSFRRFGRRMYERDIEEIWSKYDCKCHFFDESDHPHLLYSVLNCGICELNTNKDHQRNLVEWINAHEYLSCKALQEEEFSDMYVAAILHIQMLMFYVYIWE